MPRSDAQNEKRKQRAQPADRIFAVLDAVAGARRPLSLADIAAVSSLPGPTAHRLVGSLEKRGFLKRSLSSRKLLLPGPRLTELGRRALQTAVIADQPHLILVQLASEVQEHCQIGTVTNDEVHYIDAVQIRRASGLQLEQGRSAPLHCTSIGKLYLASLEPDALNAWLGGRKLDRMTPRTITDPKLLVNHLQKIRKQGWASNDEEYGLGIVGCSMAIGSASEHPFFAVGISAPAARIPHSSLNQLIGPLKRAADRISAVLGNDSRR